MDHSTFSFCRTEDAQSSESEVCKAAQLLSCESKFMALTFAHLQTRLWSF